MEKLNHPSDLNVRCQRYGLPRFPLILRICKSEVQGLIASYGFVNFRIPTEAHISWLRCSLPAWWVSSQLCVAPPQPRTQRFILHSMFVACSTNTKCWKPEMQCCCQASYGNMHSLRSLVEEQAMFVWQNQYHHSTKLHRKCITHLSLWHCYL